IRHKLRISVSQPRFPANHSSSHVPGAHLLVYLSRDSRQTIAIWRGWVGNSSVYLSRDSRQTIASGGLRAYIDGVYLSRDSRQTIAIKEQLEKWQQVYLSRDSRQTIATHNWQKTAR